ncbi:MAG: hypothetical protein MUF00_07445 [Gemmatimonadaceae bacterium]|jgi:hypothetical protein|nr:hypothetical protein [Gemmatimonadaceae bacterium]
MTQRPQRVRKQYANHDHALIVLRFEDGHEIKVYKGKGKEFDAWPQEKIKLMVVHDGQGREWDLLETRTTEQFEDASDL